MEHNENREVRNSNLDNEQENKSSISQLADNIMAQNIPKKEDAITYSFDGRQETHEELLKQAQSFLARQESALKELTNMDNSIFGQGGTDFSTILSEACKNLPAENRVTMHFTTLDNGDMLEEYQVGIPDSKLKDSSKDVSDVDFMDIAKSTTRKTNEVVYISDCEVTPDGLSLEEKELLQKQQKNIIENLLKDPNVSVIHYEVSEFTKLHTDNTNDILNKVVENSSFPTLPALSGLEKFRFTDDSVRQHSLDNLANRIKTVNTKLNPNDVAEDNKPKLK